MTVRSTRAAPPSAPSPDFAAAVLALRPALVAFGRRLARDETDAEDLAQETIVKALAAEGRFEPGTRLRSWLLTILRNSFNTRYVRSRRETLPGPAMFEFALSTPATQGSDLASGRTLDLLLDRLSPAHREVLVLIPVLGLAYEEVAELCGCKVGTVKSRLNRARRALDALIEGEPAE